MAVKLILLDLDGTLLTGDKRISPANYAALERAVDQGIHIVPSTGRFYDGMPQVVRDLPFVRYVITVNGAQIYDAHTGQILHRAEIPLDDALAIADELDRLPVIYDCFLDGWGYMDAEHYARIDEYISDPRVSDMVRTLRKPVPGFRRFLAEQGKPLQKMQMFFRDMDRRAAELERLPRVFSHMSVTSSITNNIEINCADANKGAALGVLCRHLGIDIGQSMSFGDGSNDLSMIRAAGIGVAMANACDEAKALADWITVSCDEDGVARGIHKFCFGEA